MVTKIGLDLGYANITLSDTAAGIYREPSVALMDKNTSRILSLGTEATEKASEGGVLVRPFKNGLLYSKEMTGAVIENAISAILPAEKIRAVLGLPSSILPKQEKDLYEMMQESGVAECYGVHRAMAALIGAGYSPSLSAISVNIGASATEIMVLHKGSILLENTAAIGGEDFDRAVKNYISDQSDVSVSLSVASAIKERLGAVWQGKPSESLDIEGTLSLTGNRITMNLTTEDVVGVFEKPLSRLLLEIADIVKKIPLPCVNDIFENGIVLSGGGAMLFGLDRMIERILEIPVVLAKDPMDSVAKGLSRINNFLPARMRGQCKDITSQLAKFYEARNSEKNNK
ncbi:MAG: rod shape-determining protein [Clostridia bacterium]|nr:rod shape-determining protein [Clostridia bacterium]